MNDLRLVPLSSAEPGLIAALMDEEEEAWLRELDWDYGPVRRILRSLLAQRLLPGYIAVDSHRGLGYTYFLVHRHKAIIGSLFCSRQGFSPPIADAILSNGIESLQESASITRIEAQVIPFNGLVPEETFERFGFKNHPRYFMALPLEARKTRPGAVPPQIRVVPWDVSQSSRCAELVLRSYANEDDSSICEDYCSLAGCETYLRSLVENPGCGSFLRDASYVAVDSRDSPCGLIVSSRISPRSAMLPQVSISPDYQGMGLGTALIHRALEEIAGMGFEFVALAVTKSNRRALTWYERLGFSVRKGFGAFVWQRP